MKKLMLFILLGLFFMTSCNSQKRETDLEKNNLKGNVRSLKEVSYEAITTFGKIHKGSKKREFFIDHDRYITFNEIGNKTEEKNYSSEGNFLSNWEYKYNDKGLIRKISRFEPVGTLSINEVYEYDDNLIVEYRLLVDTGKIDKTIYKLNENGNVVEETHHNFDSSVFKKIYEYDNKGNLTTELTYSDGKPAGKTIYVNNDTGDVIADVNYYPDGSFLWKSTYVYDDKHNLIEFKRSVSGVDTIKKYEYTYDSRGNWIKKIEFKDDFAMYILERTIVYFD